MANTDLEHLKHELHEHEANLLKELRHIRRGLRRATGGRPPPTLTMGQRIADSVASTMGSWPFIIVQTTILAFWIIANVTAWINHWDKRHSLVDHLSRAAESVVSNLAEAARQREAPGR